MSERIAVYESGKHKGYCDLQKTEHLGEVGTDEETLSEFGEGYWTELRRTQHGVLLLVGRYWCDGGELIYGNAELIDRDTAVRWMAENTVCPPSEWFESLGLIDFTTPQAPSQDRTVIGLAGATIRLCELLEELRCVCSAPEGPMLEGEDLGFYCEEFTTRFVEPISLARKAVASLDVGVEIAKEVVEKAECVVKEIVAAFEAPAKKSDTHADQILSSLIAELQAVAAIPTVPNSRPTGACPYRLNGQKLLCGPGRDVTLSPREARCMEILLAQPRGVRFVQHKEELPNYPKHFSSIKSKLKQAGLPDHISTPGDQGKGTDEGAEYKIDPL
jgi:hypothetical protein